MSSPSGNHPRMSSLRGITRSASSKSKNIYAQDNKQSSIHPSKNCDCLDSWSLVGGWNDLRMFNLRRLVAAGINTAGINTASIYQVK